MQQVSNMMQLKQILETGKKFIITDHQNRECIGQRRRVNIMQPSGCFLVNPDNPDAIMNKANNGRGYYLDFSESSVWRFHDGFIRKFWNDESFDTANMIMEIIFLEGEE